jgi:hypothetical protein
MSKDSGYLVETKTGKEGRTYHREGLVNKKMVVHIKTDDGKDLKMLCDPQTIKIKGFVD